jgi:hypothetical protein
MLWIITIRALGAQSLNYIYALTEAINFGSIQGKGDRPKLIVRLEKLKVSINLLSYNYKS